MGRSRHGGLTGASRVVVGQPRMPVLEQRPERAVEGAGADLQQQVGAAASTLHLLILSSVEVQC